MDKKISQLTAATTPLTGAEELAIVQSGVTKKTTIEDVKGYKVYTALLTQSGGDNAQYQQSGDLTIGVTYYIDDNAGNPDFTNVGAPNNNVGTYFVATGTTPNSWGEAGLAYNTGAPVVTVLENTIGNIWFSYASAGSYLCNSDSLFTADKTYSNISNNMDVSAPTDIVPSLIAASINYFYIFTYSISADAGQNDRLFNTPIEIRVYN